MRKGKGWGEAMFRILVTLVVCLAAGACASYRPTPIWPAAPGADLAASENTACRRAGRGATHDARVVSDIRCQRARIAARDAEYRTRASSISRDGGRLDGAAVAATIASLGMVVFEAHPDNLVATGLSAGVLNILREQTDWRARYAIYLDGSRALSCLLTETQVFEAAGDDMTAFANAHATLNRALRDARERARGLPAEAAGQSALDAALAATEARAEAAARQFSAINLAGRHMMDAAYLANDTLHTRERRAMPDVGAIMRLTREFELERTDPSQGVAEKTLAEAAGAPMQNLAEVAAALHRVANDVPQTDYHAATARFAACVARAAGGG